MSLSDKKTSGERLRIKAADWNAILDAARKVRENPYFNSETSPFLRQSSICKVKNESGSDQPRFAVLGLDEPIILPTLNEMEFKRQLTFRAVAPVAGTHEGKYAILLEPLADDAIGDAVISGVVPCKLAVNILDSVFGWAEIADGVTATLNNVKVGTARVLWAEDEGTERWALVRVADSSTGDPVVTQVTWTTDQTDYLLPADTTDLIIESMDAAHTLHSMISGHNGRTVRIHNASDYDLFLDSGTGTAGAWFSIASGETTRIMPGEGMTVTWTTTQDAWQIMDKPGVLVCDSAGTPVSVATDAIRFNEVQGVSVSKTDDNEATVGLLAASATQMGAVNTTAQTLAGQKVFSDGALFLEFTTHRSKTVTWSTDQTDYAIGDAARVLYVNATADVVLNSILFSGAGTTPDSGGEANARFLIIVNTNATYSLTLKHQASTGTAAERFYCDGAADIVLSYRQAAYGWYDPNLERHVWFKFGGGSGSPGGSDTHVQFNDSGSFGGEAAFAYDKTTNQLTVPGLTLTEDLLMSAITDSGSSNLDDYNPTGLATASTILYTAGAAINLTGIAGGATGRILVFFNLSPYTITVKSMSGSSTFGNQFLPPDVADYSLPRMTGMILRWDSDYWLIVAGSGGSSGGSYTDEEAQDAVGAMADSNTLTYTDATPLLAVKTQMSVTSDGSGLKLSGDSGSPGNSKLYGTDGSGTKGWYSQPSSGAGDIIYLRDEKTQNTGGGTFTSGARRTRDLNTEVVDTGNHCTLSSNQFTLAAGTYEIIAFAPGSYVSVHQAYLVNVTDSTTTLVGSSEISGLSTDVNNTPSTIMGRFTISGSKTFEIQHQCGTTRATTGFGSMCNFTTEVYTQVWLRKVA